MPLAVSSGVAHEFDACLLQEVVARDRGREAAASCDLVEVGKLHLYRHGRPNALAFSHQAQTSSAMATAPASISSGAVRSRSKVVSEPEDFLCRSATTGRSSSPWAIARYQVADLPNVAAGRPTISLANRRRLDPEPLHLCRGHRPDPMKFGDWQGCNEVRPHRPGQSRTGHSACATGRQLGKELVVGNTRRRRETGLIENARADIFAVADAVRRPRKSCGDVEKASSSESGSIRRCRSAKMAWIWGDTAR